MVCTHSPHGDEYALLVQCQSDSRENFRLCSLFDEFHAEINIISPPEVAAEDAASRKEAVEENLVERGRKQLQTALNAVEVSKAERKNILTKYGAEWKLKEVETRVIGVSTGVYLPFANRVKNWAKHADEALEKAKARDGKNGIAVYYEYARGVLSAEDGTSQCLKPSVKAFYEKL